MQFINYVPRVQPTQQLFIVAPALFKKLLHTYICLDIYFETVGVVIIEVLFRQQVLLITFFIIEIAEDILSAIQTTYNLQKHLLWSMISERDALK